MPNPPQLDRRASLHPLHAFVLAASVPLFVGALLSDYAYSVSFELQWKNFASWLLVGALIFAGIALAWALVGFILGGRRSLRAALYPLFLGGAWASGFIDALVHAKDAYASMPSGLILSAIAAALAIVATWLGFSTLRSEERI